MTSFRDLGPAVGSAASAAAAGASWAAGNEFLTAVLAALAGSLLTIYFNGLQQRKAWQRDVAIRMTAELYGPLYTDVSNALDAFVVEDAKHQRGPGFYNSDIWSEIKRDYRYRVLDDSLRKKLDNFYNLIATANENGGLVVEAATEAFLKAQDEAFGAKTLQSTWQTQGIVENGGTIGVGFNPEYALAHCKDVMKFLRDFNPRVTRFEFVVTLNSGNLPRVTRAVSQSEAALIFGRAESKLHNTPAYRKRQELEQEITVEGVFLHENLGRIVEEPWKI